MRNFFILLVLLFAGSTLQAENENLPASKQDSNLSTSKLDTLGLSLIQDDPSLWLIDSLLTERFKASDFYFGADSGSSSGRDTLIIAPDSVIEARLLHLNHQTPFELEYNKTVKAFINLYTVKKQEVTQKALGLSSLYFPLFEEVLDQYQLPLEFKYLAVVESALNPTARSRAGAVGLWQFMYYTGKMFDLEVSSYVDDRMDPIASTHAACKYFNYLYNLYGNWELVMAAYNCGPGNVNKAIRRSGGKRNFWDIYYYLPRETRGYVPAFIAVNYVMNYAAEHGIKPATPVVSFEHVDTVHVNHRIHFEEIANAIDVELEIIEELNPQYKSKLIPYTGKPQVVRLPKEKIALFVLNEDYIFDFTLPEDITQAKHFYEEREVEKYHYVRSGEYLGKIASQYGVSVRQLMSWNNLRSTNIRVGQRLSVYTTEKVAKNDSPTTKENTEEDETAIFEYYDIQAGDTLWDIAKQQGISLNDLKELNADLDFRKLKPGDKIKISKAG